MRLLICRASSCDAGRCQDYKNLKLGMQSQRKWRKGVNKLAYAPEEVNTEFLNGEPVKISKSNLKVRFLIQAIPSKPPSWNFQALIRQVQLLEEETKILVKLVPNKNLD